LWATELGNNQATNITNKEGFGNKKEKDNYAQLQ
jgi:hypothetical protein